MSDYAGAKAAIRSRLEALWATTRITYQNEMPAEPWPPTGGDGLPVAFVNLEIVNSNDTMVGSGKPGDQVWRYDGLIHVHVFVPTGAGTTLADQYAVAIGEIFRAKVFYNAGDGCYVRTWAPRVDGGGSSDDSGNWFRETMTVPWEYWHRG